MRLRWRADVQYAPSGSSAGLARKNGACSARVASPVPGHARQQLSTFRRANGRASLALELVLQPQQPKTDTGAIILRGDTYQNSLLTRKEEGAHSSSPLPGVLCLRKSKQQERVRAGCIQYQVDSEIRDAGLRA